MSRRPGGLDKILDTTLFCYVEEENAEFAREEGKRLFGSFSGYVNALIARDRGVSPKLGSWKAAGESKKIREEVKTEKKPLPPHLPSAGPGSPGYRDPVV